MDTVSNDDHRQHALYRFYDTDGQLLYVGITLDPGARWKRHSDDKKWWADVRGASVEWYDTRTEVRAAETRAIHIEHPLHNLQRPSLPGKHVPATQPVKAGSLHLIWICEVCAAPIADETGYIHMEWSEANRYVERKAAWKLKYDPPGDDFPHMIRLDAYDEFPNQAHWHVHHADCDPDPDSGAYTIDIERARTHAKLLNWTAHLMGKNWLMDTDWDQLIQRMCGVDA